MNELSEKQFSDIVFEKLDELEYGNPILTNPTTENEFPLIELHTPLRSISKSIDNFPIDINFQISITCWNDLQRNAMDMTKEVEQKLRKLNFTRTSNSPSNYDPILKKYGITITFEVRYNAITNSFVYIR